MVCSSFGDDRQSDIGCDSGANGVNDYRQEKRSPSTVPRTTGGFRETAM
jgi:hypothetical protein